MKNGFQYQNENLKNWLPKQSVINTFWHQNYQKA